MSIWDRDIDKWKFQHLAVFCSCPCGQLHNCRFGWRYFISCIHYGRWTFWYGERRSVSFSEKEKKDQGWIDTGHRQQDYRLQVVLSTNTPRKTYWIIKQLLTCSLTSFSRILKAVPITPWSTSKWHTSCSVERTNKHQPTSGNPPVIFRASTRRRTIGASDTGLVENELSTQIDCVGLAMWWEMMRLNEWRMIKIVKWKVGATGWPKADMKWGP